MDGHERSSASLHYSHGDEPPVVSVVLPTYNRYRSVVEAVRSIDYASSEVIVVDDGSEPPVEPYLAEHGLTNLTVVRQPNRGVSSARNTGMQRAKGQYIAFLDSDDYFVPGKLQEVIDLLEKLPELDFAFHDIGRFSNVDPEMKSEFSKLHSDIYPAMRNSAEKTEPVGDRAYVLPALEVFRNLTSGTPIFPSSVVLRRRVIESIAPWSENYSICEDMEYFSRALLQTDALYIDKALTQMGIGDANLSKDPMQTLYADIAVIKSLACTIKHGDFSSAIKASASDRLQTLGWHRKKVGNIAGALEAYKESLHFRFRIKPFAYCLLYSSYVKFKWVTQRGWSNS